MIPKFRFYNIKLNKIYEVVGIDFFNLQVDCLLPELNNDISFWDFNVGILMQSTGLFDKNGTEIFEGDILKVFVLRDMGAIARVIFKNGMFGIEDDMHGYGYDKGLYSLSQILSLRDAEIIGNIYQDKHLLEED